MPMQLFKLDIIAPLELSFTDFGVTQGAKVTLLVMHISLLLTVQRIGLGLPEKTTSKLSLTLPIHQSLYIVKTSIEEFRPEQDH